jgi:hypothetical protein
MRACLATSLNVGPGAAGYKLDDFKITYIPTQPTIAVTAPVGPIIYKGESVAITWNIQGAQCLAGALPVVNVGYYSDETASNVVTIATAANSPFTWRVPSSYQYNNIYFRVWAGDQLKAETARLDFQDAPNGYIPV